MASEEAPELAGPPAGAVAGASSGSLAPRAAAPQEEDRTTHKVPGLGSDSDEDDSQDGEEEGDAVSSSESEEGYASVLLRLKELMAGGAPSQAPPPAAAAPALSSFDLAGVAELIRSGAARRIVCMCGAGISVSAGIPDFRTPGSGLYHRLEAYNLPYPQAVFEIDFFRRNPKPFFLLARELFPGSFAPTPTHHFMRLLHDKGLLLRCFTQNIDSLELEAGLPRESVIAAHGNFDSAACIACRREHSMGHVREAVFAAEGNPAYCLGEGCRGLVKPDIVFFGESLPERFFRCAPVDLAEADLLIVMGTSLVVHPFASLIDYVGEATPRLLINREKAGEADPALRAAGYTKGFDFHPKTNTRDALFLGDCDSGVAELARLLGWEEELAALVAQGAKARVEATGVMAEAAVVVAAVAVAEAATAEGVAAAAGDAGEAEA